MSILGSSGPPDLPIGRGNGLPTPRMGITQDLAVPGLVTLPAVDRGAQIAQQALIALGVGGKLTAEVLHAQRVEDEEAMKSEMGLGVYTARAQLPGVQEAILKGELVPGKDQTPQEWAEAVADSMVPTDSSEAVYEGARKQAVPGILDAYTRAAADLEQKSIKAHNAALSAGAQAESTPDGIRGYIDEFKRFNPRATDLDAISVIVKPAAERAAAAGDTKALESAIAAGNLDKTDPILAQNLRAKYDDTIRRLASEKDAQATQDFASRLDRGDSPEALREYVDGSADLLPATKVRLKSGVDARASQQLEDTQRVNTNNLTRDILLKRFMPDAYGKPSIEATTEEIIHRADLPPTDPKHINAERMNSLINSIQQARQFDVRRDNIEAGINNLAQNKGVVTPATAKDDQAFQAAMAARGLLTGTPDESGKVAVTGIANPTAVATLARQFNRVPEDVSNLIVAGLSSSDPVQAENAAVSYAAIYLQSPTLAAGVVRDNKEATLRAAYIAAAVERQGADLVADPEKLRDFVAPLSKQVVKLDPTLVDYTREQAVGRALLGDAQSAATLGRDFYTKVNTQAQTDIKQLVFTEGNEGDIRKSHLFGLIGNAKLENVPANITETYLRHLDQQFRVQRSLIPDEARAVDAAKKAALARTLYDHPPQAWNGRVLFRDRGTPTIPEAMIDEQILTPSAAVPPDETARKRYTENAREILDTLKEGYAPEWDGKGFVFRSLTDPSQRYIQWTQNAVGPLRVTFDPATGLDDLTARIEAARAARRQQKPIPGGSGLSVQRDD